MKQKKTNDRRMLKKESAVRNFIFLIAMMLAMLFIGTAFMDYRKAKAGPEKPLLKADTQSPYSEQEMHDVWTNDFQNIVVSLFSNAYPLQKIQERFDRLSGAIVDRYHTNVPIHLITTYMAENADIFAGCYITNGQPQLDIIIPRLLDIIGEQRDKADPEWRATAQDELLVGILHEFDHIAIQKNLGASAYPPSLDELVEAESAAWAQTCEHTITLLIEEYHAPLPRTDHIYYEKWVAAGHNENSPLWKDFIRSAYVQARK